MWVGLITIPVLPKAYPFSRHLAVALERAAAAVTICTVVFLFFFEVGDSITVC